MRHLPLIAAMRLLLVLLAACSANKDAPPPAAGSEEDPRTAVRPSYKPDGGVAPTVALDAAPIDAPPSPEAIAWNARWTAATAHEHPRPATNPDWPCATESVSTGTTTIEYAGPAKCTVPPDEVQIGCPTKITAALAGGSPTIKTLYYDAKGFLVGAKLEREGKFAQRALYTYDGDHAVAGELDATGDGNLESRTRYERDGTTVRWSVDFGLSGKYGNPTVFVLADGRVQSQATGNTITEFRWRGARLVERQYKIKGEDSSKTTYRYSCAN